MNVEFNEQEKQVIDKLNLASGDSREGLLILGGYHAAQISAKPEYEVTVWSLLKSKRNEPYYLASPSEAKQFEQDLIANLKKLKASLEDNMEIEQTFSSFEL